MDNQPGRTINLRNLWNRLPESYNLEEISRLFERLIERALEMNQSTARIRGLVVFGTLFITWSIYGFGRYPFYYFLNALEGLFIPANVPEGISSFNYLITPILQAYFSLDVVVHILAIFLPFFLALEFASIYQADIYKLPHTRMARAFLTRSIFNIPPYETLRIVSEGLTAEQQRSTMYRIGGPGIVKPNLEFAAIFERTNGAPHFIWADLDKEERTLAGFERLRRIIDTRDHTFHYDKLTGRTKDGIKIHIQDINLLFSIWRRNANNPLARPYPAYRKDLYWLTYRQPAKYWVNTMTDLVREYMLCFIQKNNFGSLLAAIGEPEIRRQIEWETTINRESLREPLRRPLTFIYNPELPLPPPPPVFVPRPQVSNFFKGLPGVLPQNFNCRGLQQDFPSEARNRGLRLDWINVGTWVTLEEVVFEQHLEAWRLTNENLARSNPRVIEELRKQAQLRELTREVQQVPLLAFASFASQNLPPAQIILLIMREYENRIRILRGKYLQKDQPVPAGLERALFHINRCLQGETSRRSIYIS